GVVIQIVRRSVQQTGAVLAAPVPGEVALAVVRGLWERQSGARVTDTRSRVRRRGGPGVVALARRHVPDRRRKKRPRASARGRSCSLPPGGASAAGILTQQLLAVLLACEDRHLHAPVQRTARLTLVRGDRLGLATARRTDAGRIDAEVDQVVARGCSTPLRQAHVVGVATLRVRVTDDQQLRLR